MAFSNRGMMNMNYSCLTVEGGWRTFDNHSKQFIGPAFHKIQDLWKWQRENLMAGVR